MPDSNVQNKVYKKQGGDEQVVGAGGKITFEDSAGLGLPNVGDKKIGLLEVIRFDCPDVATANYDLVLTEKRRVVGVEVVKTGGAGGAGNTITVKNGTDAISDAIDTNDADKTISKAATIDDAFQDIIIGGTLRVTNTKVGSNAACIVYVHTIRVA